MVHLVMGRPATLPANVLQTVVGNFHTPTCNHKYFDVETLSWKGSSTQADVSSSACVEHLVLDNDAVCTELPGGC